MNLRQLIPFFDTTAQDWAWEARLLRWMTFVWLLMGLGVVFSASLAIADAKNNDGLYYFKLQIVWILVGLVGFNLLVHIPIRYILGVADWLLLAALGLIAVTVIPGIGISVNGAARWLFLGPIPLQPSEFIKPFLVLQSARIFGQWDRLKWVTRLLWIGVFGAVLVSILLQPNLSTAALCGVTLWLVALAAGLPYLYLAGTAGFGLLMAVVSVSLRSYQRRRILSFLNPWADPQGDGYQLVQSLLAVGSGGLHGTGFGGSQQKLFYLPEQYTDFIFSIFAEEFGFVGGLILLVLLMTYGTLAMIVAIKAQNPVHRLVAVGVMVLIVGQALLNIGVATGALPTTGLPFPLLSYGGSSMISSLIAVGLLVRVAREGSEERVVPFTRGDRRRQARQ